MCVGGGYKGTGPNAEASGDTNKRATTTPTWRVHARVHTGSAAAECCCAAHASRLAGTTMRWPWHAACSRESRLKVGTAQRMSLRMLPGAPGTCTCCTTSSTRRGAKLGAGRQEARLAVAVACSAVAVARLAVAAGSRNVTRGPGVVQACAGDVALARDYRWSQPRGHLGVRQRARIHGACLPTKRPSTSMGAHVLQVAGGPGRADPRPLAEVAITHTHIGGINCHGISDQWDHDPSTCILVRQ